MPPELFLGSAHQYLDAFALTSQGKIYPKELSLVGMFSTACISHLSRIKDQINF
ncbi:hypothetical protein LC653_39375 [Nostoc sp. CHAB 5784]|uniref:hypothetical protein n=1 Tax=Nostoc mirabile TaxID=2907820 RepID=UPI001E61DD08|nr:hypothetical protein [Nostoc mirabile]MCC5669710.1 hypothetical protein [Nostoc mirabile CHAB5784]